MVDLFLLVIISDNVFFFLSSFAPMVFRFYLCTVFLQ